MSDTTHAAHRAARRSHPLHSLLGLFSNVWFGITLMVLLFLYMTVASAGLVYPISPRIFSSESWVYMLPRKHPLIDKTEMEIFAWWPFNLLIGLLVLNMAVVTVRRIRLTWLSLGVWMIHTGIIILALGSVYYFGTKLEGDTPVFRRHIVLEVPGADQPQRMIVRPNNQVTVNTAGGDYRFAISSINPNWPILSDADIGKTACSVNLAVTTPTQSFIRQMLIGYPQYTEDILPGQGRAVNVTGNKLLDDTVKASFALEPQTEFYLRETAALYLRPVGSDRWIERPVRGLPHYSDHVRARTDVWQTRGDRVIEPDPLDIRVPAVDPADPLPGYDLHITGRLHYAPRDDSRWVAGGRDFNPVASVAISQSGMTETAQLMAFHPTDHTDPDGRLAFRWAESADQVESFAAQVGSRMTFRVPGADFVTTVSAERDNTQEGKPDLPFQPLGETGWSYRIRHARERLQMDREQAIPLASVELKSGDEITRRWVTDDASKSADVAEDGSSPIAPNPAIEAVYRPGPLVILIGGPERDRMQWVVGSADNRTAAQIGAPVDIGSGTTLTVAEFTPSARLERRPVVVPKLARDPNAGNVFSRVRLSVAKGSYSNERWLAYHRYPLQNEQYAIPGRFIYQPSRYALPDGRQVEIVFSRKRWPLPAAVALEAFELKTHTGGFVQGATTSVRDFVSLLRVYRESEWSQPFTTSLNKPASDGGMYYFQAEWDPGQMAYTGLGVGNRNGVGIQLLGCCISVAGMIWVFYIKPSIKRRRRQAVWAQVADEQSAVESSTAEQAVAAGGSS